KAGKDGPWSDSCQVQARLSGQSQWTTLSVPVVVVPATPTVELTSLDVGVDIASTSEIDLMRMVRWAGGHRGDSSKLRFDVDSLDPALGARLEGSTLTLAVDAGATPGVKHSTTVGVSGQGEATAQLAIRIKHPPPDNPEGGQVSTECTVGSSCSVRVIGVEGEYDPFANSPGGGLTLSSITSHTCSNASPQVSGETVSFTWNDPQGSGERCQIGFQVVDAQGKQGEGRVDLDARGLPGALGSIEWSDYGEDSVTLTIGEGASSQSYPEVEGVEVSGPGNASCSHVGGSYRCQVTGLRPGEKGTFSAQAVNSIGSSAPTSSVEAWAYRTPPAPSISVTQVDSPSNTNPNEGRVRVSVEATRDTKRVRVSGGGTSATVEGASGSTSPLTVAAGKQRFTAVAESNLPAPPIRSASPDGGSASAEITVVGAPRVGGVTVKEASSTSVELSATGVSAAGSEATYRYGLAPGSSSGGKCTQTGRTFTGLESHG
ncbi:MAG TPA: fibronectin type III domain-containing protein, partial [Beutenbergiaceae bacterium]|nr:fibronectin type III domain-containing protein [Beutenbergiaceae bacterium]